MRSLTGAEVIAAWEAGHGRHPLDRALILAAVAAPDAGWDALCRLRIGERDRLLFALREAMSGEQLPCYVACPACGAGLELTLRTGDLHVGVGDHDADVAWDDYHAQVRAPDSLDLAAVVRAGSPDAGLGVLVARCVEVRRGDAAVPAEALPAPLLDAIAARMAALDPGAELVLAMTCPDCGHAWGPRFDIAEYLWNEVAVRAHGLLRDTDVLARVYGWSEAEILALSDLRRRAYLELARS
jgi:hypothetical protein